MPVRLTAFRWVPPFAQGYVKDLRVRWALEEAGWPHEVELIDPAIQASARYRRWQPFGQVPAYRDDEVEMFESGAILLHIAAKSDALSPANPAGRARVMTWVVAALNAIEPHVDIVNWLASDATEAAGMAERRGEAENRLGRRLADLAAWLEGRDHLEGRFTAADIAMTTVLRELVESGALAAYPVLDRYRARCEARPAFGRALEAQLETFRANTPA